MAINDWFRTTVTLFCFGLALAQPPARWKAHDMDRPQPPVVTPAPLHLPVPAPSDATILFDGTDLSQWQDAHGNTPAWKLRDGYMEVTPRSGGIRTRMGFGDIQLHIEWAAPDPAAGDGQDRGNSGIHLMGLYEVQVLDCHRNRTYADGQAASVYGQYPPLANACLPPGEWQAYDLFFRRPRFDSAGTLLSPAQLTVVHNGVLVQNMVELRGPTTWLQHHPYRVHPDRLPLALQDHASSVRYRNIWLRELPERDSAPGNTRSSQAVPVFSADFLERYVGSYEFEEETLVEIRLENGVLHAHIERVPPLELVPQNETEFSLRWTAARIVFELNGQGVPEKTDFYLPGEVRSGRKVR